MSAPIQRGWAGQLTSGLPLTLDQLREVGVGGGEGGELGEVPVAVDVNTSHEAVQLLLGGGGPALAQGLLQLLAIKY